jgi:hypothetical protein
VARYCMGSGSEAAQGRRQLAGGADRLGASGLGE